MENREIVPPPPADNEDSSYKTIPLYTAISPVMYTALSKYVKDYGHRKPQDVVRMALSQLLKKEGYL